MPTETGRPRAEVLGLLGLARRAGALAWGVGRVRDTLRGRRARLVLVAGDASAVQLAKLDALIERTGVARVVFGDRVALGAAVGEPPLSAVAVTDVRFAERLLERLGEGWVEK